MWHKEDLKDSKSNIDLFLKTLAFKTFEKTYGFHATKVNLLWSLRNNKHSGSKDSFRFQKDKSIALNIREWLESFPKVCEYALTGLWMSIHLSVFDSTNSPLIKSFVFDCEKSIQNLQFLIQ